MALASWEVEEVSWDVSRGELGLWGGKLQIVHFWAATLRHAVRSLPRAKYRCRWLPAATPPTRCAVRRRRTRKPPTAWCWVGASTPVRGALCVRCFVTPVLSATPQPPAPFLLTRTCPLPSPCHYVHYNTFRMYLLRVAYAGLNREYQKGQS